MEEGSSLFLDMLGDARILFDRDQFLVKAFARLRARLERLGGATHLAWKRLVLGPEARLPARRGIRAVTQQARFDLEAARWNIQGGFHDTACEARS